MTKRKQEIEELTDRVCSDLEIVISDVEALRWHGSTSCQQGLVEDEVTQQRNARNSAKRRALTSFARLIKCYQHLGLASMAEGVARIQETLGKALPVALDDAETWDPRYLVRHFSRMADYMLRLDSADTEHELQTFLEDNPTLIYPDYLQLRRKQQLGSQYETDFAFLVQDHQGLDWVFVEIERSCKKIFREDGCFTSEFTQAKGQLLDWEVWMSRHNGYLRSTLPYLADGYFHLIMGRNCELSSARRLTLRAEFGGTTRRFSTYDDLLTRYNATLINLLGHTA